VARAIVSKMNRRPAYEPLYERDPQTGATIEVFFADRVLAESFGAHGAGWCWWTCKPGCLPDGPPIGPFGSSYAAYRDALGGIGERESAGSAAARIAHRWRNGAHSLLSGAQGRNGFTRGALR
jgi:hypothetical protein